MFIFSALGAFNGSDITINDIKNALPDGVSLPPELDGIEIPKVEEAVKVFKEKCVKVSGSDAAFEEANVSRRKNYQANLFRLNSFTFSKHQQL